MRKILVLAVILLFSISETFAFAIKVYDEYGNRVGTYRKSGKDYQLYDFYDNRVDNPETLIKNPPDKKTLTEYTQTLYDENMMPIWTYRSGFYGNNGKYYPRRGYYQTGWSRTQTPYIVRPNNHSEFFKYADYQNNVNYVDTRYPKFHKFKY